MINLCPSVTAGKGEGESMREGGNTWDQASGVSVIMCICDLAVVCVLK